MAGLLIQYDHEKSLPSPPASYLSFLFRTWIFCKQSSAKGLLADFLPDAAGVSLLFSLTYYLQQWSLYSNHYAELLSVDLFFYVVIICYHHCYQNHLFLFACFHTSFFILT
ncbi:hypothetical protein Tcan_06591 [Toxocara canis]|uniref:Uncharacterized protein n=1 Tax=Toxocara canis TaxID=6265 RepID=A0A0B2V149_TOXCA|nr:hypothetical protein Tcan_06591 [Toxocara canis]